MSSLKRYCYEVFFTALNSVPNAHPPFIAGRRDTMWVTVLSTDHEVIKAEAKHKAQACYGLQIDNISIGKELIL